jgi:hypothetical protein
MNFAELRQQTANYIKLGGWANVQPEPELDVLVNSAYRQWTNDTQYNVEDYTITTVSGQQLYSLATPDDPRKWVFVYDDVQYNTGGNPLAPGWIQQGSLETLRQLDRNWRSTPAVNASGVVLERSKQHDRPVAIPANDGVLVSLQGVRMPQPLVADDDVPTFNSMFHSGIAYYAAYDWGLNYSRGEERDICMGYKQMYDQKAARFRNSLMARNNALIQRRVTRPDAEYIQAGANKCPCILWLVLIRAVSRDDASSGAYTVWRPQWHVAPSPGACQRGCHSVRLFH